MERQMKSLTQVCDSVQRENGTLCEEMTCEIEQRCGKNQKRKLKLGCEDLISMISFLETLLKHQT